MATFQNIHLYDFSRRHVLPLGKALLLTLFIAITFSCQRSASSKVVGEYVIQDQGLIVNGAVISRTATDYPGAKVSVQHSGGSDVTVTLSNIILGHPTVTLVCATAYGTKSSSSVSHFFGITDEISGRHLEVTGNVTGGNLKLNIVDIVTSTIEGKWMVAPQEVVMGDKSKTLPDIHLISPGIGKERLDSINYIVARIAAFIFPMYDYHHNRGDGIFSIGFRDNHSGKTGLVADFFTSEVSHGLTLEDILNSELFYYEDTANGAIHLYIKESVAPMLREKLPRLPTPLDISFSYTTSEGFLSFEIDRELIMMLIGDKVDDIYDILSQYKDFTIDEIIEMLPMEYRYIARILLDELGVEESVRQFVQKLMDITALIRDGDYRFVINCIPYVNETRPWEQLLP